jgi:hypothetical protein
VNEDIVVPVIGMLSVFVFFPIAIGLSRFIWKRASAPSEAPQVVNDDMVRRMAELQRSMDAMALEVERISEGQRFITKVMSERPAAAIPASTAKAPASKRGQ